MIREHDGIVDSHQEKVSVFEQALNAEAVIVTDLEGHIGYWNGFAERVYHWEADEVIGKRIFDFIILTSNKAEMRQIMQISVANKCWEGEFIVKTKEGDLLKTNLKISLLKDKLCRPTGFVLLFRDISKTQKIEGYIARLDRLNLVGEMAASIGHEVRNPITTVRGFLQILASKELNVEQQEYFNLMIQELDRANFIITEYLSLAKNKTVQFKSQNLNQVIKNLLPLLEANAVINDVNIETRFNEIPNLYLDYRAISQLVLNIAYNGIEAMPSGGRLTFETYVKHNDVVLTINDQGVGIPPELLDRIGEPFLTTKEKGTGLGMAICYSICSKHNAAVQIESNKNGTTFFVYFPIEKRKSC